MEHDARVYVDPNRDPADWCLRRLRHLNFTVDVKFAFILTDQWIYLILEAIYRLPLSVVFLHDFLPLINISVDC